MSDVNITFGGSAKLSIGNDRAVFQSDKSAASFRFKVFPEDQAVVIGVWKGDVIPHKSGVARSQPGKNYCDHVCGKGKFVITVTSDTLTECNLTVTDSPGILNWFKRPFLILIPLFLISSVSAQDCPTVEPVIKSEPVIKKLIIEQPILIYEPSALRNVSRSIIPPRYIPPQYNIARYNIPQYNIARYNNCTTST